MNERVFTKCLNHERKYWNRSLGSIVLGVLMFALVGLWQGLMWGLGSGAIGFVVGGMISKHWYLGLIQRKLYWNLPLAKTIVDRNTPDSSDRELL